MDTFEIKDNEIDIEDITRKIKDNVKKRYDSGVYTRKMENLVREPLQQTSTNMIQNDLQSDLNYLSSNSDIRAVYNISSHRPIVGRFLIWGRKLVHGEVKRYVDILSMRQIEFNMSIYRIIDKFVSRTSKNEEELERIKNQFSKNEEELERIKNQFSKNADNIDYFVFSEYIAKVWNKLSGEPVQGVSNIYEDALKIFNGCKNVLDIGCGSGTFLKILNDDVRGYGIDINEDFILLCKREKLKVEQIDVIAHLKSLQDKTLDGIFAAHVIEHMTMKELEQLIELCFAKMQFGSHIIFVTPNILNMSVSSNYFYMDPTHLSHLHPGVIRFLLKSCGFRDVQERFYQPVPNEMKLKKIDYDPNIDDKKIYETMNHNIDMLNNLLFGYRDFVIIAKK